MVAADVVARRRHRGALRSLPAGSIALAAIAVLASVALLQAPTFATRSGANLVGSQSPSFMEQIYINDLHFDPLAGIPAIPSSLRYSEIPPNDPFYYLMQLSGPVTQAWKDAFAAEGVALLHYVNYNAFIVHADGSSIRRAETLPWVRWTGVFEPAYKMSPHLSEEVSEDSPLEAERGAAADLKDGNPAHTAGASRPTAAVGHNDPTLRPSTTDAASGSTARVRVIVLPFVARGVPAVARAIHALGGTDILWSQASSGVVRAEVGRHALAALAREPEVMWIERETQAYTFNDLARWVIQSGDPNSFATPVHARGIFGTGQVVTVSDTGIDFEHNAFEDPSVSTPSPSHRKVTAYYIPTGGRGDGSDNGATNHGTHVSGSVAGDDGVWHVYDGNSGGTNGSAGPHDGQAFDATLQVQDLSTDGFSINPPTDLHTMYQDAKDRGSAFHTNSWGSCCGDYIAPASQTDDFIWNNPDFIVLYAAGNSGSSLNTMNPFAVAKNVIAVGATQNGASRDSVASFSSRGPARDGRLKPDVMAPGVSLWSARGCDPGTQCDTYWQLSGTSMATPTTAGAAALVRQYYIEGWHRTGTKSIPDGFTPTAALVKATLINCGAEMTGSGAYTNGETRYPNFNQGWGRVLLDDALYFQGDARDLVVDDRRIGIGTGDSVTYQLAIGNASVPVEVTLVWSDYPGIPLSNPNLVNDLDLTVTAPDGTSYAGNQYTGYNPGESVRNPSGSDHLNNVEGVLVRTGVQAGLWTVRVSGFNVPQGPQPYALVMTGGIARERGVVQMDRNRYQSTATVAVTVVDAGLNVDPTARDTATVTLTSTTETVPEPVTVTETGTATSTFVGSIPLQGSGTPVSDGILQVQNGNTITAEYFDANDGLGGSGPTVDAAVVDDVLPVVSGVSVVGLRFFRATIAWTTDEPSDSAVEWGTARPPEMSRSDGRRVTSHSILLSGLTERTTYYYAVGSMDEAGNTARSDNGTSFFRFTTPPKPPDSPRSPEWPEFHNNRERGGVSPEPFALDLTPRWANQAGSRIRWSGPVISDRTVFFTEREGTVHAVAIGTGETRWQVALGDFGAVHGTPAVADGNVYVALTTNASSEVTLFGLDSTTGAVRWEVRSPAAGTMALTTPALAAGNVYWHDGPGRTLRATNATTGATVWTYAMPDRGFQGPTVWAGIVFATDATGNVLAVDASSGEELWRMNVGSTITSAPTVAGGVLYVGDYSGALVAIEPLSGNRIWTAGGLGRLIDVSSPVVAEGRVFVGVFATTTTGRMVALNASTGAVAWSTVLPRGPVASSAAYANGTVFLAGWDGNLYAWDASNGTLLQELLVSPAGSTSSIALGDGFLVVGDEAGKLSAFGFVGGGESRRMSVSPAAATVVVGTAAALEAFAVDGYDNRLPGGSFNWSSEAGLGTVFLATDSGSRAVYVAGTTSGSDVLRVTAVPGTAFATIPVEVLPGPATLLDIGPTDSRVVAGGTIAFSAIAKDRFGNAVVGVSVSWTSSAGAISSDGVLTAPATTGSVLVRAAAPGLQAQTSVTVVPGPLDRLAVSRTDLALPKGTEAVLRVRGLDAHGNEIDNATLTWSTTIGTIEASEGGRVAVFSAGTTEGAGTITVASEGTVATIAVTVTGSTGLSFLPDRLVGQPTTLLLLAATVLLGVGLLALVARNRRLKRIARGLGRSDRILRGY